MIFDVLRALNCLKSPNFKRPEVPEFQKKTLEFSEEYILFLPSQNDFRCFESSKLPEVPEFFVSEKTVLTIGCNVQNTERRLEKFLNKILRKKTLIFWA